MSTKPSVTVFGNGVAGFACARDLAAPGARVTTASARACRADRPPSFQAGACDGPTPVPCDGPGDRRTDLVQQLDGRAEAPDLGRRELTVRPARGDELRLAFQPFGVGDRYPTGAAADRRDRVCRPNSFEPASLEQLLPSLARPEPKVVVVGAGQSAQDGGDAVACHRVTLIERAKVPLEQFHRTISTTSRLLRSSN